MESFISLILLGVSWITKDPLWAIAAGAFAISGNLYSVGIKFCNKLNRKDVY